MKKISRGTLDSERATVFVQNKTQDLISARKFMF